MATTKVPSRCAAVAFSMKKEGGDEITTKLSSLLPSQETGGKKMSRVLLPFQKSTNMGSTILTEFNNMFPFRHTDGNGRRPSDMSKGGPFPFPSRPPPTFRNPFPPRIDILLLCRERAV